MVCFLELVRGGHGPTFLLGSQGNNPPQSVPTHCSVLEVKVVRDCWGREGCGVTSQYSLIHPFDPRERWTIFAAIGHDGHFRGLPRHYSGRVLSLDRPSGSPLEPE